MGLVCEFCGLTYKKFRTNLTFRSVLSQFPRNSIKGHGTRARKKQLRRLVLGRWHEIKQLMWKEHLYICEQYNKTTDDVPF